MRRLTLQVVLGAFIFSCGGQWYALQAVAWANMIREYSDMVPFSKAVEMTFSGEHPCALCNAIAGQKKSDNEKLAQISKFEIKIVSRALTAPERSSLATREAFPELTSFLRTRTEPPPLPPPRFA